MTDHLKLKNQVCFPIYALAKEMVNHYRPLLDNLDLTYPQYLVLLILWEQKEQSVGQLGEKLFLDSGTLTPLLKRMEQKGFIVRSRSSLDERVVNLSLTKQGLELQEKAKRIPVQLMESMHIAEEDLDALKNIVTKILNKQK
ncbi:MarR family transcriptional regulator [Empedobacter brevis]|uniref:Organic hydroperoxide resistance transcriptional regulator n=2 Tax=Empedobacter brevis TaxID=247 RepID=A0A511NK48_9FLAO|nr:MarR family transcriptional regulator [Empedobacter brevis]MDM1074172.1 MarR family transcriptional regulator [Empedobacter brevis]QES94030.1 MarR family transcriptional regulator [Empedobacter brevis]QHC85852.1 MarR family transcriptional regulator [Empedobacter brevis]GEM53179.1 organic hydroperoxide resistance transcriptional regulator [Empedobacter brevis NBRC 14943 = ATCC 43319]